MEKIEILLSEVDTDRLYAVKKLLGHEDLSGSQFAGELLADKLYEMFPGRPDFDENGNILNEHEFIRPES